MSAKDLLRDLILEIISRIVRESSGFIVRLLLLRDILKQRVDDAVFTQAWVALNDDPCVQQLKLEQWQDGS